MNSKLLALLMINVIVGAMTAARGRELKRRRDPSALTGTAAIQVRDAAAYTAAVGGVELLCGWLWIIEGAMLPVLESIPALLVGDGLTAVLLFCLLRALRRKYSK